MASLNFPSSPTVGQTYVSGGRTWTWNGTSWEGVAATTITGPSGPTGAPGSPGDSGYSGISGYSGRSGYSGTSGYSGSGISGYSGTSGYSGAGTSGFSGISGYSGSAGTGLDAGATQVGYINYNGLTKTASQMYGGTSDPTSTARLNYDGYFYATRFYGDGSQLTGVSAGATITDDTTTNGTRYILFDDVTSGSATTVGVSSTKLYFNPSSGTLYATVFQSLSDANKKTNITPITDAVSKLDQINGVEFDWLDSGKKSAGVIAQEIEQVLPHLVEEWDGVKSVNYSGLIAYLIESNKELARRISTLENRE